MGNKQNVSRNCKFYSDRPKTRKIWLSLWSMSGTKITSLSSQSIYVLFKKYFIVISNMKDPKMSSVRATGHSTYKTECVSFYHCFQIDDTIIT